MDLPILARGDRGSPYGMKVLGKASTLRAALILTAAAFLMSSCHIPPLIVPGVVLGVGHGHGHGRGWRHRHNHYMPHLIIEPEIEFRL